MTTTDLAAWLIDRIAEDEEVARAAAETDPPPWTARHPAGYDAYLEDRDGDHLFVCEEFAHAVGVADKGTTNHIARHDPARVLAECQAKRRIVKAYEFETDTPPDGTDQPPAMALRLLAQPYSDRDGYDPAWAVE